jgi:hypothetical protein
MKEGEAFGWNALEGLDPTEVAKRAGVIYDAESESYSLNLFSSPVDVFPGKRAMTAHSEQTELALTRFSYFSKISVLSYLANAKDIEPSGHIVKPAEAGALSTYFEGSHALPLDGLAGKYGADKDAFIEKGKTLGATVGEHGDVSLQLHPFEKIPVELVLWLGDDEFPARADLLVDSTCGLHVPADIIWSISMMSVLIML